MGETAILNLVATPPPTPAQSAQPSPTPTPGAGDGRAFAAELDRRLKVLRPTYPGLGSDAGKGREAGESSSAAAAGEKDSEQGQSADPGRAFGTDRLALVAQLFAAVAGDASAGGTADPTAEGGNGPVLTAGAVSGMATGALTGAPAAGVSVVVGPVAARANAETVGAPGVQSADLAPGTAAALSGDGAPTARVTLPKQATAEAGVAPPTPAADEIAARGATVSTPVVVGAGLAAAPKGTEASAGGAPRPAPVAAGASAATVTVGALPGNADAAVVGAMMMPATEALGEAVGTAIGESGAPEPAGRGGANGSGASGSGANEGNIGPAKVEEPAGRARIPATGGSGRETALLSRQSAPALGISTPGGQPAHSQATSQAGPQAAPAHVPAQSVIDQLLAGAKVLRRGPVTELQVQLKPESLGRVDLKVSMENGVLSARILVDNPGVKAALEANLPQLKQSLADQGIALQGMTVGYGGERGQSQGDAQQGLYRQEVRPEPQYGAARQLAPQDVAGAMPRRGGSHHRLDLIM